MPTVEVIRRGADGFNGVVGVVSVSSAQALSSTDSGKLFRCLAGVTLTVPSGASNGWSIYVDAVGGAVVLSGGMLIDGGASAEIPAGAFCQVYCDGTSLFARYLSDVPAVGVLSLWDALSGDRVVTNDDNGKSFSCSSDLVLTLGIRLSGA
ncbi:hypothetical protein P7F88_25605 [Vibrio hannami]|uniref:hypothetical protein n=1 Tax=Vibrio hannami TaxID=2717094 RepID=UPI00240F5769|nr:hypothetical protein [Vibrio hannami]MDG3089243.1 hypothetical protein [Vibrio hannami]